MLITSPTFSEYINIENLYFLGHILITPKRETYRCLKFIKYVDQYWNILPIYLSWFYFAWNTISTSFVCIYIKVTTFTDVLY